MADIKFACANCGQHLTCDSSYAGRQIACPSCQAAIQVPNLASPPVPGLGPSSTGSGPPPVPHVPTGAPPAFPSAPGIQPSGTRPTTCGLAIASLACSCAGLLFGFLGTIPGILLGFRALRQIRSRPNLGGKGLATAGVVTGFVLSVVWIPVSFILVMGLIGGFRAVQAMKDQVDSGGRIRPISSPTPTGPGGRVNQDDITTDLSTDPAGWFSDVSNVAIPDTTVSGRLQGLPFAPREIELDCGISTRLEFTYRFSSPTAEELLSLTIDLEQEQAANFSGRTLTVTSEGLVTVKPADGWNERKPKFRMVWIEPGTGPAGSRMRDSFTESYPCAMRIEFGQIQGQQLPGRIYLCLFDRKKSFLRGKFVAAVKQSGMPLGTMNPMAARRQAESPPEDTTPDAAGWTLDLSAAAIPEAPATGRVHGAAFRVDRASFEGPMLKLRQGVGFWADREFEVIIWEAAGSLSNLCGKTIEVNAGDMGQKPHVRVSWMERGGNLPESISAQTFAMKLEFGQLTNGRLPGRIYLCTGDYDKSFVRGKFVASLPQTMTPGPASAFPRPVPRTVPKRRTGF